MPSFGTASTPPQHGSLGRSIRSLLWDYVSVGGMAATTGAGASAWPGSHCRRRSPGWELVAWWAFRISACRGSRSALGFGVRSVCGVALRVGRFDRGDWRRDHVSTSATLASPDWGGVRSGLTLRYTVGQGSRDNDPRPLYRLRRLGVTPGFTVAVGAIRIGATATLALEREEGEIGAYSQTDPFVFRLRGITTFDRTGLRTADRTRTGGTVGAGVQVGGREGRWTLAIDHGVDRDSTFDGVGTPSDAGRFRRTWSQGTARARFGGVEAAVQGRSSRGRGTDPIFRAVNVVQQDDSVGLVLRTWRGRGLSDAPVVMAAVAEVSRSHRRDIAAGSQWSASGLNLALGATLRLRVAGVGLVLVGQAGVLQSLASEYVAGRPSVMTPVLGEADYRRFAADGVHWMAAAGLEVGAGHAGICS